MKVKKTYELASFKALPEQPGYFEAVVSVFGNVDLQGDRVMPGAFSKSIDKWKKSGDPIPIIWSHEWGDPFAHIGFADPNLAEEIAQGLKLVGHFDVHKPFAKQVYDLVKERRVKEWSFAYDVEDERTAQDRANELLVLDIIEAGPTLKGANPDTVTLGVKHVLEHAAERGAKIGRVLSTKNESSLRQAHNMIGTVLASLEKPEPEEDEAKSQKSPPWHIEQRGDQFCVVKDEDNSTVACHPSRADAEAHLAALYANVPDAAGGKAMEEKASQWWYLEERGGEFCVINSDDDSSVECFAARNDAISKLEGLYATRAPFITASAGADGSASAGADGSGSKKEDEAPSSENAGKEEIKKINNDLDLIIAELGV